MFQKFVFLSFILLVLVKPLGAKALGPVEAFFIMQTLFGPADVESPSLAQGDDDKSLIFSKHLIAHGGQRFWVAVTLI